MSTHPDLAAYILGQHDDSEAVEAHIAGCDACLEEVGREARLELLLHAAGREDAFAAVVVPARRRRWPLVAAAGLAVAAAAIALFALWPSRESSPERRSSARVAMPTSRQPALPAWAADIEPGTSRCTDRGGDLMCAAASTFRGSRHDAEDEATDRAREALLDQALAHGDSAIRAQRALCRAPGSRDRVAIGRTRHQVASHTGLGQRSDWYWEEYDRLDGPGTEFLVFVRLSATADQVADFLAGFSTRSVDGADIAPVLPCVRWVFDPGDDMAWFVYHPGSLAKVGVRAGDVLVHDQRRRAVDLATKIRRDEIRTWRAGRLR